MAAVDATATAAQAKALEEKVEIAMAREEAAQAELATVRNPPQPPPKVAKPKKERALPKPATPCSCSYPLPRFLARVKLIAMSRRLLKAAPNDEGAEMTIGLAGEKAAELGNPEHGLRKCKRLLG